MFDEMKKPRGENVALYVPREMARLDLFQAVFNSSFLVSYIFLEKQVTEAWSAHLVSYNWRMSQGIPVLWIEKRYLTFAFQT